MLLYPITLLLSFPVALTYDRLTHFRNRRVPAAQSGFGGGVHAKRNPPFVIRVPYSKIVPSNALFSHSVSWKAKPVPTNVITSDEIVAFESEDESSASATASSSSAQPDLEVSQFHAQDTNGQVVFGFNAPDQMRIEQRNADGTVHGTYSYLDPYGHIIKRQYWDTGAGFHVTSNTYPFNEASTIVEDNGDISQRQNLAGVGIGAARYTSEVQAARDLNFQLYQQALASFLPNAKSSPQNDLRRNGSVHDEDGSSDGNFFVRSKNLTTASEDSSLTSATATASATAAAAATVTTTTTTTTLVHSDSDQSVINADQGSIDVVEPDTENGSIVIQKPEYLRISWTTENKKYRVNAATNENRDTNRSNDNWSVKSTTTSNSSQPASLSSSRISNATKLIV